MTNQLFPKAREKFLGGDLDWDADTFQLLLVKTAQVFDSTDEFVSDLSGANIIARSDVLATKTKTDGTANCDPATFTAPTAGNSCNVYLYRNVGSVDSTSDLVAYYDTAQSSTLPVLTNGADVIFQPDTGPLKLFRL